jgi:hypothetical protein
MSQWRERISRTARSSAPEVLLLNPVKGAPGTRGTEESVLRYSDTVPPSYLFGRFTTTFPAEPLYFGMLAGTLRAQGISCEIADGYLHRFTPEEMFDVVVHLRPRIVAIAVFHNTIGAATACARRIKVWDPSVTVVIGSAYASPHWREIVLWPEIDHVVVGDGELAMVALARAVLSGTPTDGIPGVAQVQDGKPTLIPPVPLADLDSIAFPARDLLPLVLEDGYGVSVYGTRGCAFGRCTFCYLVPYQEVSLQPRWRARSATNVVDEIEDLVGRWGVRQITFVDEDYFGDNRIGVHRAVEIAEQLIARNIRVKYYVNALVKSLLFVSRAGHLPLLAKSGMNSVFTGFETSSTDQLKSFLKPQRPEQYDIVIDALRAHGIWVNPGLITFTPTSTLDDVLANVRLAERMRYYDLYLFSRLLVDLADSPVDMRSDSMASGRPGAFWRDAFRAEHEAVCTSFADVRVGALYQTMRILCSLLVEHYQVDAGPMRDRLIGARNELIEAHYRAVEEAIHECRAMRPVVPPYDNTFSAARHWFDGIVSIAESDTVVAGRPTGTDEWS